MTAFPTEPMRAFALEVVHFVMALRAEGTRIVGTVILIAKLLSEKKQMETILYISLSRFMNKFPAKIFVCTIFSMSKHFFGVTKIQFR